VVFNRFLLDEVLAGRPQGSLHEPVITVALEAGAQGRALLEELHRWWRQADTGQGDPLALDPAGTTLGEAEQAARRREPGPGGSQRTVLERLGQALEGG
jgi:hypothetical protein